jgi:hypothetical protein
MLGRPQSAESSGANADRVLRASTPRWQPAGPTRSGRHLPSPLLPAAVEDGVVPSLPQTAPTSESRTHERRAVKGERCL